MRPSKEESSGCALARSIRYALERRKAEARRPKLAAHVHEAQKLDSLAVLASATARDFNNVLQLIMGHVALLRRDSPPVDAGPRSRPDQPPAPPREGRPPARPGILVVEEEDEVQRMAVHQVESLSSGGGRLHKVAMAREPPSQQLAGRGAVLHEHEAPRPLRHRPLTRAHDAPPAVRGRLLVP